MEIPAGAGSLLTRRKSVEGGEEVVKPIDYRSIRMAASWKRGKSWQTGMTHSNQSELLEHLDQVLRDFAFLGTTSLRAVHLEKVVMIVSVRECLEVLVLEVEKQATRDTTRNVYSLVGSPIGQEVEDRRCCRERDQRKGLLLATGERGSTERQGMVESPSAWEPSCRMDSEEGKWVVGQVGVADRDMIEIEVNVMPDIDLGDQASLGYTSRPDSSCRV